VPYPIEVGNDAARYGIALSLSKKFDVKLIAADSSAGAADGAAAMRSFCEVVVVPTTRTLSARGGVLGSLWRNTGLLRGQARSMQGQHSAALGEALAEQTAGGHFGLVHFDYWTMSRYRAYASCPAVLLNHDAWFQTIQGYSRQASSPIERLSWKLESVVGRRREVEAQRMFDWRLYYTEEDRRAIIDAGGPADRTAILPLACPFEPVDVTSFEPPSEKLVLFSGALGAPFNIDALVFLVDEIWPLVRRLVPDAQLLITGREPAPRVQRMASVPGVTVAGWVPDLAAVERRASVFVAPMRIGTGIKVKVAHAMSSGLPVVATPLALRGLPKAAGVFEAGDAQAFAGHVAAILQDRSEQRRLAESCVEAYREHLWLERTWSSVVELYERMLDDLR
jgi:glycosyltransferase involved in cell wall biosynthesis